MPDHRRTLGAQGEALAAAHLARQGYRIVGRNVRADGVELDLVAARGNLRVFVEVKTRGSRRLGLPEEAVDGAQAGAGWSGVRRPGCASTVSAPGACAST